MADAKPTSWSFGIRTPFFLLNNELGIRRYFYTPRTRELRIIGCSLRSISSGEGKEGLEGEGGREGEEGKGGGEVRGGEERVREDSGGSRGGDREVEVEGVIGKNTGIREYLCRASRILFII